MNKFLIASHTILLASITSNATAAQPTNSLETIVVTATRTDQNLTSVLASTTVITRQDILTQQAKSVQDILRGVAGIDITNNGGAGKASSMFIRGTESDHVIFLINGIKVGSATLGTESFQMIPIEEIERIEIVRGPMSSLYGSEAIGGVVNIFTREAIEPLTPSLSAGMGSNNTKKINAGLSGRSTDSWYSVGVSHEQTDGFDACSAEAATGFFGCFTDEPDDDGFRNESLLARAGHRFGDTLDIEINALRTQGNVHFDGGFSPSFFVPNETDFMQQALGAKINFAPNKTWRSNFSIGESRDKTDNRQSVDGSTSYFDTTRKTASWQNDVFFDDKQTLTLGLDYQDEMIDSDTNYAETSRDNKAVFAQYQVMLDKQDIQLAVRSDDNEQFGNRRTANVAWAYESSKQLRLSTSYGTAFKAPTFNELYFPNFGNTDISPETAKTLELGLRQSASRGSWSVALYHTNIDDLIGYDPSIGQLGLANNISKTRIIGVETSAQTQLYDWVINGNVTLQNPENRDNSANDGNLLPRRSEQSFRLDADRKTGQLNYGFTFRAVGERFDDPDNTRKLAGYGTFDLRMNYRLQGNLLLEGSITNVLNKAYEDASGYNTGGDMYFVGIRYSPAP
ncbi:MAG: TonB-dependent vitamin B12 receptor [Pseudomonadales bacterium]|nr:TonB-dependent vitamin B12 receptor [Pseudomonadales bacterium]